MCSQSSRISIVISARNLATHRGIKMLSNRLVKHFGAAAAAAIVVGAANAAIVTWNCNLVIPANIDGQYMNVETQTYNPSAAAVPGWDINPYSGTNLSWFNATGAGMMRYPGVTTGSAGSLAAGTVVGGAGSSMLGTGAVVFGAAAGNWTLNAQNYFGFKFLAADGLTHFGFGRMDVGATALIRTIAFVSYETIAGATISIVCIPAPGAIALLGLVGLTGRRRR